ncbi:hypothetical protein SSBR45G_04610 [Bradyrhizobium sp. SSBR45G]|uniref:DUF1127 domain-containing protein n=1 Tax=unclassified Bradyrhizobium TaxID=2631580 RepID=UPI002342BA69|nr:MULTISPECIES: DUF1127 domain-containing protein [unclassified Bradyrhizobium]GLH75553.1 hypothetical protein SSBR45G_04610 [Bradyrhizobium sp. SSBR45G]GLH82660.1 hypothetical protein SSBR45R_01200 [Bradyrhizobium sp. SSBR45R]
MPSTTDDPSLSAIKASAFRDVSRSAKLFARRRDLSSSHPVSSEPGANVYYLARPAPHRIHGGSKPASLLRLWWERWRERRRFARELPWMADESLEDYGLTREEARRLCRRPFWRA